MADGFRVHEYWLQTAGNDLPSDPQALPLVLDRRGKYPEPCLENVGLILEGLRPWQDVFAYDELAAATMLMRPIPGTSVPRATFRPRELRDDDTIAAARWFNKHLHLHPRTPHYLVGEVVQQVARQSIISPVRHYLEALVWDQTGGWTLADYLPRGRGHHVSSCGRPGMADFGRRAGAGAGMQGGLRADPRGRRAW